MKQFTTNTTAWASQRLEDIRAVLRGEHGKDVTIIQRKGRTVTYLV